MLIHSANPAKPPSLSGGSRPTVTYLQRLPAHRLSHQEARRVHGSKRANALFSTASQKQTRRQARAAAYASGSEGSLQELHELEAERDEAVARAETCGITSQKLEYIITMLEKMALEKIKNGDEEGARAVLVEKSSVKEALASNAAKASANAMLVQKLAPIIASKQQQLPTPAEPPKKKAPVMWPPPPTFPSASKSATPPPPPSFGTSSAGAAEKAAAAASEAAAAVARIGSAAPASSPSPSPTIPPYPQVPSYSQDPACTTPSPAPGWDASSWAPGEGGSGASWPMPKWQKSLEEARARLQAEEEAARATGRTARLSAEESVSQAKARLQMQAENDLQAGLQRVRQAQQQSLNSIEEARQRIQEQDRQVLALVQQIMAKYRRGDYVPEEELEFAFQQLERRFTV